MKNAFDRILTSVPVSADAAKVLSRGVHYDPHFKPHTIAHSDLPLPIKPKGNWNPNCEDLVGTKFGRFTVVGLYDRAAAEGPKKRNDSSPAGWVVRCVCGRYEVRRAKAIRNPANSHDACRECRNLVHIKRRYEQLGAAAIPRPDSSAPTEGGGKA